MKVDEKLTILVGAGFSKPAGLPLINEINQYFIRNNVENLLHMSSGEWKWIDFANATEINNESDFENIAYGYILNQLVKEFTQIQGSFDNYEDFYQFVIDLIKDTEQYSHIVSNAFQVFKTEDRIKKNNPNYEAYTYAFRLPNTGEVKILLFHLIADLLFLRKDWRDIEIEYVNFVDFLKTFSRLNVITLNHDRLMEKILTCMLKWDFCDGFSNNQRSLFSSTGNPLYTFNGDFSKPVSLIKLHGSIDTFNFAFYEQKGGQFYPTGEQSYFKTMSFTDKQTPILKDPKTGEIIDRFNFNILPQFISGTNKEQIFTSDFMYKQLYSLSEHQLLNAQNLMILGYSYNDKHVNKMIEQAVTEGQLKNIININPSKTYACSNPDIEVINIHYLNELSS